jgi:hypothetical protein
VKVGLVLALVVLILKGTPGPASLEMAHWMLLWGVLVVAPLALHLCTPPRPPQGLKLLLALAGLFMATGWLWQGKWLVAGALLWLLVTLAMGFWGAYRLWTRRPFCLAQTTSDVGFLYAPVGGVWTFAYAWPRGLMGFDPTMTLLTGVHFCFVTLGAMHWSGLAGQFLGNRVSYRFLAVLLWVSPALVAGGITYTHALGRPNLWEGLVVAAQVTGTAGISLLWLVWGRRSWSLTLSALCSLVTMALALNYAWGRYLQAPHLDLAWMIPYHGLLNALGFVTLGLWGFRSLQAQQAHQSVHG